MPVDSFLVPNTVTGLDYLACLLTAVTVLSLLWLTLSVLAAPAIDVENHYEIQRRQSLRTEHRIYRYFEGLVDSWKDSQLLHKLFQKKVLAANLRKTSTKTTLTANEAVALTCIETIVSSLGLMLLYALVFGVSSTLLIVGSLSLVLTRWYGIYQYKVRAEERLETIRQRLPFAVDLLALMMEAGSDFRNALKALIEETGEHPLSEELQLLLNHIQAGLPQAEAFELMQQRLDDPDVDELVVAVNKGEELGTRMSQIFLSMATEMRKKRSDRTRQAAETASNKMLAPCLLVLLSCLVVIVAPFLMHAVEQNTF